jgi:hypothetical protein
MEINGVKKGFFLSFCLLTFLRNASIADSIFNKMLSTLLQIKVNLRRGLAGIRARWRAKKMMECADDAVGLGTVGFSVESESAS